MGVGLANRRRRRARARRARQRRRRPHHVPAAGNTPVIRIFGKDQHISSTGQTPKNGCNTGGVFVCGAIPCIPGIIVTCIGYVNGVQGMKIAGLVLLAVGSALVLGSAVRSFVLDWKNDTPNASSWNERIRATFGALHFIFGVIGLSLGGTGFGTNTRVLVIAGYSIMAFAFVLLLLGILLARYGSFDSDVDDDGNPASDVDDNPDAPPDTVTTSDLDKEERLSLLKDWDYIGWALYIPGICFMCIGWIKPYFDPYLEICGGLGAACFATGALILLHTAVFRHAIDSSQYRRPLLTRVTGMFLLSGITFAAVGFTHQPDGYVLGVFGACFLGVTILSLICNKCSTAQESPVDVELGHTVVNSTVTSISQSLAAYRPTSGSNQASTTFTSYTPPTANATYPATSVDPAYPQPPQGTAPPPPPPPPLWYSTSGTAPTYPPPPLGTAPTYLTYPPPCTDAAYPMPPPPPPLPGSGTAPSYPMTDVEDSSSYRTSAPPADGLYNSSYVVTPGDDIENLPPPPSYDEVVKGASQTNC